MLLTGELHPSSLDVMFTLSLFNFVRSFFFSSCIVSIQRDIQEQHDLQAVQYIHGTVRGKQQAEQGQVYQGGRTRQVRYRQESISQKSTRKTRWNRQ